MDDFAIIQAEECVKEGLILRGHVIETQIVSSKVS